MSTQAEFARFENIAVLYLDNPPVNSLGTAVCQQLHHTFAQALAEPTVDAIIIAARGKVFSAGADISEFQSGTAGGSDLRDLLNAIAASSKPVVAAIQGMALGGGLELTLACNYRLATPSARLGLPEVSLGVIPGAGGTQRLPRIIGLEKAIELATSGKPVSAKAALEFGLVDQILPEGEDFHTGVIAFARSVANKDTHPSAGDVALAAAPAAADARQQFEAAITKSARGRTAPLKAFEAVWLSTELPLEQGLEREAEIFLECNASEQGRGLQHIFFAERKAAQIRDIPGDVKPRAMDTVAIIGAGTMGGGIAMNFLNAGIPVTILDLSQEGLDRGLAAIRKNYEISAARGKMTAEQVEQRMGLLGGTTSYAAIGDADLVIEAVFENMDVKKKVFATLDTVAKSGAILATNTSTLDVNEIAAVTSRPQDVIGLHFFSPANVMRLVEIVRARETAPDALKTALHMCKVIKKVGVVVGVCFGFVGNRMMEPYGREAHRLLLEGATPDQIDHALTQFGMSMGPLSVYDLAGNDIGAAIRQHDRTAFAHDGSYYRIGDLLSERGQFGQKAGMGFYRYEGRDKSANPDLAAMVAEQAAALGIAQREISDTEIVERCLYPLVDEGIRILEEGIAQRPGDIDVVWCNGYGFPPYRGGPMHWADEVGMKVIYEAMMGYRESLGDYGPKWFNPSDSLEKLVQSGAKLTSLFPND